MEWLYIVAALLAIPVMAVVAFFKSVANQRELRRIEDKLNRMQITLGALVTRLDAEQPTVPVTGLAPEAPSPEPVAVEPPPTVPASTMPQPPQPSSTISAPPPPSAPRMPPSPSAQRSLEESLTSRWFVWLGAVAVALGGTFLVKYAIDEGWLGPATRCVLGFLLGCSLAASGEWLRRRPLSRAVAAIGPNYVPPALTASGLFVAFASIYAAYSLYGLLAPFVALLALAAVALLAVGLSLLQGIFVALMGVLGAFITPALVTTPSPSAWGLFAFLLVVLAAALSVARYRGWWWLALSALAGVVIWPLLWIWGSYWTVSDELPVGAYLLLAVVAFHLARRGWESAVGSDDWLIEMRSLEAPERVVWIASLIIAVLFVILVGAANFSATSLVLFALAAALSFVAGRREGVFDALPIIFALATLALMASMPLPGSVVVSLRPHAPLVPRGLETFITTSIAFGAMFGMAGFATLWGAKRPAMWAAVSAGTPVLLLTICYWRVADLGVDLRWATVAAALALICLFAAERVERYRATRSLVDSLGLYAAGVVAFLSLAATMSLREAWLTVALSLQLPLLAWIHRRIVVGPVRILATVVAGIVLVRLVLNYNVLSYHLVGNPAFSWVVYGYGIPALSFFAAAQLFHRRASALLVGLIDAGALVFAVLLVSLEIRLIVSGRLDAPSYTLLEQSLQSISWLAIGTLLAVRRVRDSGPVFFYGSRILLGLASAQILVGHLLLSNPVFSHEFVGNYPLVDLLFLAYAVPAAFAFALSVRLKDERDNVMARLAAVTGFVLLFAYISLEVRHAFQGVILQTTMKSDSENYAYSVVWLIYAISVLALGIVLRQATMRYASLAIFVIVVLKVFLFDMGDLTGLYRVFSFLGLGLSLVGIGLVYQRYVFPTVKAQEKAS